jgi:hypothetical protein
MNFFWDIFLPPGLNLDGIPWATARLCQPRDRRSAPDPRTATLELWILLMCAAARSTRLPSLSTHRCSARAAPPAAAAACSPADLRNSIDGPLAASLRLRLAAHHWRPRTTTSRARHSPRSAPLVARARLEKRKPVGGWGGDWTGLVAGYWVGSLGGKAGWFGQVAGQVGCWVGWV